MGYNMRPIWAAHMLFANGFHMGPIWTTHIEPIWDLYGSYWVPYGIYLGPIYVHYHIHVNQMDLIRGVYGHKCHSHTGPVCKNHMVFTNRTCMGMTFVPIYTPY